MATFEPRKHKTCTTFRVKWREDGAWQSATFVDRATARRFKKDVELYDNRWPLEGWLRTGQSVRPLTQADLGRPVLASSRSDADAASGSDLSFGSYAAQYVRDKTGLQPDTRTRYGNQVIVLAQELDAIVAADDDVPAQIATLRNLTSRHVSRWINAREAEGAKPKTVRNWHGLLFQILQAAADEGLRVGNPCVRTGKALPRRDGAQTSESKVFLNEAEFGLIADAVWPGLPDPKRGGEITPIGTQDDRELLLVAVGTGLRWGELTALKVRDVDLSAVPRVLIERAWKTNGTGEFARRDTPGRKYLGAPKTSRGRRRVRIGQVVSQILEERIRGREPDEYVFFGADGRPVNQGYFYRYRWLKAVALARRNGLMKAPRIHDLRHTTAAWLISAGVPLPEIQQRLGHESIKTTVDTYGGLLEVAGDVANQAIDKALGPASRGERPAA